MDLKPSGGSVRRSIAAPVKEVEVAAEKGPVRAVHGPEDRTSPSGRACRGWTRGVRLAAAQVVAKAIAAIEAHDVGRVRIDLFNLAGPQLREVDCRGRRVLAAPAGVEDESGDGEDVRPQSDLTLHH